LCPSLRIRGQLPAPIVNGVGDRLWKWPDFQLWRARDHDLDLKSGQTAVCIPSCITHRPTCEISLKSEETFCGQTDVWTHGRTDGRTDIW